MRSRKTFNFKRGGDPITDQGYAREALEMANELPDTIVEVPIERGIRKGLIVPVREGVFKLVGRKGLERR